MTSTFLFDDIFHELNDDLETEVKDLHCNNLYMNFEEDDDDNIQDTKDKGNSEELNRLTTYQRQHQIEIPDYLSISNSSFRTTFLSVLRRIYNRIDFKDLQKLAILTHHMSMINLHKQLWSCYLQSGTGQLKKQQLLSTNYNTNRILSFWPKAVTSIMISKNIINNNKDKINDDIYINFIQKYQQYLEKKLNQYRIEFDTIKNRLLGYTDTISYKIDEFIQKQGLIAVRLYYETQMTLIDYICIDRYYQYEFIQQKPTDSQLQLTKHICHITLEKEKAEQELILFKFGILYKKLSKSLEILETSLPTSITSIFDSTLRERLSNDYIRIIQRAKADLMMVLTTAAEAKKNDYQKNFEKEITKLKKKQQQISIDKQLTTTMSTLIDQRQKNIIECVKYIYEFKGKFFS